MGLPKYKKTERKQSAPVLPKGAYVVRITGVEMIPGDGKASPRLDIWFDIAEGRYQGFYRSIYNADTREDKKWPADGHYTLWIPEDNSKEYTWTNWNLFFSDLEDSNNGFVFDGENLRSMIGKVLGGKFAIEQSEFRGVVYNHSRLKWTCVADDVRNGKAGKLPGDKILDPAEATDPAELQPETRPDFPEGVDSEFPF